MARRQGVGDSRKTHPLPMRLRSRIVPREQGGSEGWRGTGWAKIRLKVLERDGNRSTISGLDKAQGKGFQVDHINPFRLGGKNKLSNLRTNDYVHNAAADHMNGASEKPPKRTKGW